MSRLSIAFACLALAFAAGCGGEPDTTARATPSAAAEADLGAIKSYLLEHTARSRGFAIELGEKQFG